MFDKWNAMFRLTDPVIHYRSTKDSTKKGVFGRTDKGAEGIQNFFRTHECNCICELVTKGFRNANRYRQPFETHVPLDVDENTEVIEILD